ncbi:putative cupin superfamily protein [Dysgonomonadaceae bacterium PH5-43]|nr:putative cupin superfamily protein [Dysgonomonadaceae bacterium PH5-43]
MGSEILVGSRIKNLRETKSISIEDVSERSGLSIDQIKRIEENKDFPSLAPLIKIARVLGVRLGTFLDDQSSLGPVVSRKEKYKETVSFSTNQKSSRTHMDYYSLSSAKSGRHMEPFIIGIEPKEEGVDFILSSHEGEEFIFCMEGVIEISYGKDVYILEEGDSIYYDSIVAHHVHAADEQGAKILAVVYTPI